MKIHKFKPKNNIILLFKHYGKKKEMAKFEPKKHNTILQRFPKKKKSKNSTLKAPNSTLKELCHEKKIYTN